MNSPTAKLRKAAILVASLDQVTAESVLAQMDPEQAEEVRHSILHLGEVDPLEQDRVIEEFFHVGPPTAFKNLPGIELDGDLVRRLAIPSTTLHSDPPASESDSDEPDSDEPPFRFLHEAEFETLAPFLKREHPQTIAVVVSHLPATRAAEVLAELPAVLQVDVIRRLVDLDKADPRMLREVERGLQAWLSEQDRHSRRRTAGLAAVSDILSAASGDTRRRILTNLTRHDRSLAGRLRPNRFRFAELLQLDDDTVTAVLRAADPELLVLALAGASAEWVARFTRRLPSDAARRLTRGLTHLGPTRLADVEDAQQALADLAVELEAEGRISLTIEHHISVAA